MVSLIWTLIATIACASIPSSYGVRNGTFPNIRRPFWEGRQRNGSVSASAISVECQNDFNVFMTSVNQSKDWALRMYDTWGGIESGVYIGNTVFEGYYDECLAIDPGIKGSDGKPFRGRSCSTAWPAPFTVDVNSIVVYGLCIPSSCNTSDVYHIMSNYGPDNDLLPWRYPSIEGFAFHICYEEKDITSDASAMGAVGVLSFFGFLAVVGTLYDAVIQLKHHRRKSRANAEGNRNNNANGKNTTEDVIQGQFRYVTDTERERNTEQHDTSRGSVSSQFVNKAFEPQNEWDKHSEYPKNIEENPDYPLNENEAYLRYGMKEQRVSAKSEINGYATKLPVSERASQPPTKNSNTHKPNTCGQLLLSFSIYQNFPKMVSFDSPAGSYKCLNGIRFLSMCWIILGHSYELGLTLTSAPTVVNANRIWEMKYKPHGYALLMMNLGVESFFILSSVLTTLSFCKQTKRNDNKPSCVQYGLYYFHRFWRLTPVYMLILMMWTTFFPYLQSGPLFVPNEGMYMSCRDVWWKHLIYLNNLIDIGPENECMGWTWYMANDFQFYFIAPAFISLLFWVPIAGIVMTIAGVLGGMAAMAYTFHQIYDGKKDWYFDFYVKPWCRCTTYLLGILLGYLMFKTKPKKKFNLVGVFFGWLIALAGISMAVYLQIDHVKNQWSLPGYIAFETIQRPMLGLGVCWIIYACCSGYGGIINWILSWNGWIPLAKLTYTGYLIHPMVIFYTYYSTRQQIYITYWSMIYYFIGHLMITLGVSFLVSLFLEVPFLALEKVMFKNVNKTPNRKPAGKLHI